MLDMRQAYQAHSARPALQSGAARAATLAGSLARAHPVRSVARWPLLEGGRASEVLLAHAPCRAVPSRARWLPKALRWRLPRPFQEARRGRSRRRAVIVTGGARVSLRNAHDGHGPSPYCALTACERLYFFYVTGTEALSYIRKHNDRHWSAE